MADVKGYVTIARMGQIRDRVIHHEIDCHLVDSTNAFYIRLASSPVNANPSDCGLELCNQCWPGVPVEAQESL